MKKYFTLAIVATMFAACTNDDSPQTDNLKDTPITLSTNVAELLPSRAITDEGKLVDADLGLFVTSDKTEAKYKATNMKWTGDEDGNWTPTDGKVLYEGNSSTQKAYAYSPFTDDADDGTITVDLTQQTDYLYAESTALTSSEISLEMSHRLSKVTVSVTGTGTEVTGESVASIAFADVPLTATWTLADDSWVNSTTNTGTISADANYSALLLPETESVSVIVTMSSGRVFKATASAPTEGLASGAAYTVELKVGRDAVTMGDVRVADWENMDDPIAGGVAEEFFGYTYDSKTNTYFVYDARGLNKWNEALATDASSNLTLMNDIVMPAVAESESNWIPCEEWVSGTIDGNGHKIIGIVINVTKSFTGFISLGASTLTIKNLGFEGGSVVGKQDVGGIVGQMSGVIENCYNKNTVTATFQHAGGIVGKLSGGKVIASYNIGNVSVNSDYQYTQAGGIAGGLEADAEVVASYNSGTISAPRYATGGIIGSAGATGDKVIGCYNVGTLMNGTENANIGAIVGFYNIAYTQGNMTANWWSDDTMKAFGSRDENDENYALSDEKTWSMFVTVANAALEGYEWKWVDSNIPPTSWIKE